MPNQGNRSNSSNRNAGKGQPKHDVNTTSKSSSNAERSDKKYGSRGGDNPNRTSNQGRKTASGGQP